VDSGRSGAGALGRWTDAVSAARDGNKKKTMSGTEQTHEGRAPRVLVIGASRGIGLETVRLALASGYRVRGFSRSVGDVALDHPRFEAHAGDALEGRDLRAALAGVDAVVQSLGVRAGPRMVLRRTYLFSEATDELVRAMGGTGVRRLITVTGYGAGASYAHLKCHERLPFRAALGRVYDDKSRQEAVIERSSLDWTIVRPGILLNGSTIGPYRVLDNPADWRLGCLNRAEVADFLVAQLKDTRFLRRAVTLCR
jgi:uncharacterized protein YbjT (DUF2867 family)